jgi:flavorubredoxin
MRNDGAPTKLAVADGQDVVRQLRLPPELSGDTDGPPIFGQGRNRRGLRKMMQTARNIADPAAVQPGEVLQLAAGLYALGGALRIDRRISWLPLGVEGYQATRCYLLKEQNSCMLIDPGLRVHEDLVISQLLQFMNRGDEISVFLTRSEPDCFGCLERINTEFKLIKIITGGGHNPFDGFNDVGGYGKGARGDVVPVAREGKVAPIPFGGGRQIEVLHAPLRLNSTFWLYETGSRSLFTSDAFSHAIGPTPDDALGLETVSDFTVQQVRDHLLAKFWWMTTAHTESLSRGLRNIFDTRRIDRICPSHGRPIVGHDAVWKTHDLMQEALALSLPKAAG